MGSKTHCKALVYWGMAQARRPQARKERLIKTPADYLERIEGIHQVGGSRQLEATLGAAAALAVRIANPLFEANRRMIQESRMPEFYKNFMGSSRNKVAMKAVRLSEWAGMRAQHLLSDHLAQLGELDRGLLKAMFNKQYIKSVSTVRNHLTRSTATSALTGIDGVGIISILNNHVGAGLVEMNFLGEVGGIKQQTSATRALVLLHEAAHVDFPRLQKNFDPTPGRLSPDRSREEQIIEDINTWSLSAVATGPINAAAKTAINENWADALASMIMLKEYPGNPSVLRTVEKMAQERQRFADEHNAKGLTHPNAACGFAMGRVLKMKDRLPDMSADEIRKEAIRIASDAYLDMVESLDPNVSPEIKKVREMRIEGLKPDRTLDTGQIVMCLSDMQIEQVADNLKNHPTFELIKYDWNWFRDRYSNQVGIVSKELEVYGSDPEKLRELSRFDWHLSQVKPFALHYGDLVHDGRSPAPHGMSQDVFEQRLGVAKSFAGEWDRATKNVTRAINVYDRELTTQFESKAEPAFRLTQDRAAMPKRAINP